MKTDTHSWTEDGSIYSILRFFQNVGRQAPTQTNVLMMRNDMYPTETKQNGIIIIRGICTVFVVSMSLNESDCVSLFCTAYFNLVLQSLVFT